MEQKMKNMATKSFSTLNWKEGRFAEDREATISDKPNTGTKILKKHRWYTLPTYSNLRFCNPVQFEPSVLTFKDNFVHRKIWLYGAQSREFFWSSTELTF